MKVWNFGEHVVYLNLKKGTIVLVVIELRFCCSLYSSYFVLKNVFAAVLIL